MIRTVIPAALSALLLGMNAMGQARADLGVAAPSLVRPIQGAIHKISVRVDPATGGVQRLPNAIGNSGLEVVYDNTCRTGYFIGLNTAAENGSSIGPLASGDWGGVPATTYAGNPVCTPGCADSYTVRQFTIGYCTGAGVPIDMVLHFWDAPLNACTTGLGFSLIGGTVPPTTPTILGSDITITGLPRSSVTTPNAVCYDVTIDIGTPGFTISGGSSFPPGSTMGDKFSWSMQILNTTGGDGPILAGNDLTFSPCTFCVGSLWETGGQTTNPGTGLGTGNHLWFDNYGGTNNLYGDCFFLSSPWGGQYLQLESVKPCAVSGSFCNTTDGALASCPCENAGAPDTGCDIKQATGGVRLDIVAQSTSPNGATLSGSGYAPMGQPTAIVIRSDAFDPAAPIVFGDGVRCVAESPIVRLDATSASGGVSTHMFGHGAQAGDFHYQIWFRSTPSSFCDPLAAFNLSSGRTLTW